MSGESSRAVMRLRRRFRPFTGTSQPVGNPHRRVKSIGKYKAYRPRSSEKSRQR